MFNTIDAQPRFGANNPKIQPSVNAPNVRVRVKEPAAAKEASQQEASQPVEIQQDAPNPAPPKCAFPVQKPAVKGREKGQAFPLNKNQIQKDQKDLPDVDPNQNYSVC